MFGSRADLIVDVALQVSLTAPLAAGYGAWLARTRNLDRHKLMQTVVLCVGWAAVLALETDIRLAGGSGSLIQKSASTYAGPARLALGIHITGAVVTYLLWTWLVVVSRKRFNQQLPGPFSRRHKLLGRAVLAGLAFTAVSAAVMYALVFVL